MATCLAGNIMLYYAAAWLDLKIGQRVAISFFLILLMIEKIFLEKKTRIGAGIEKVLFTFAGLWIIEMLLHPLNDFVRLILR